MPKNALIKTNPYLKNAAERDASITASVVTSSAIEGVHLRVDDLNAGRTGAVGPAKPHSKRKTDQSAVTCRESSKSYRSRR